MSQRNRTRKAGRGLTDEEAVFVVPPPPPERVPFHWDRFLIEGDELFEYMTLNFQSMFSGEYTINNFDIEAGLYWISSEAEELYNMYNNDIQSKLIPWIMKEYNTYRLFNKENWKPFRDLYQLTSMHLGYKFLFEYNDHYFQLGIVHDYIKGEKIIKFILALYGWNKESGKYDQKNIISELPDDKNMPENFWNIK
jgi:hypothetical protein